MTVFDPHVTFDHVFTHPTYDIKFHKNTCDNNQHKNTCDNKLHKKTHHNKLHYNTYDNKLHMKLLWVSTWLHFHLHVICFVSTCQITIPSPHALSLSQIHSHLMLILSTSTACNSACNSPFFHALSLLIKLFQPLILINQCIVMALPEQFLLKVTQQTYCGSTQTLQ